MMTDSASTSSFFLSHGWTYDVFLSFRGGDTRLGFTGNLYKTLCDKGIHTFIDDEQLQRGDQITPTLFKAIQQSKIDILVLSKNYASSSFCLDELVIIMDCLNNKGAFVFPIFYDVDPSDLRHLKGSYGEALAKHEKRFKDNMENMERLGKWKMALQQVANLSGCHFNIKTGHEYEYKFIGSIVEVVSNKINRLPLHVADHPVGLEFQVSQVNLLLYGGSDDGVHMVGIYGIGGIGKTTLARAIYNSIAHQFEGLCFLEAVREKSENRGLVHLQETLLSEIVGEKDIKLGSVSRGIPIIKHRLRHKKVLLVLDDVDDLEQLKATIGGSDWFGSGSKVIITTRDKQLLTSHGVKRTYKAAELNEKDALELLSWNAFKTGKVDPSYLDILSRAVNYAGGLPLAVEVIGSNLSGKTTKEWESALDQYKRIPVRKIQDILKISYKSLEEPQQNIFLDIACCFKGCYLADVKKILSAHHGVSQEYDIGVLVEKSLIKINGYGDVTLHDLIEVMGKEIVRQESPVKPGKRSRLWFHEDIVQVLEGNMGTSRIQMINLDSIECEVDWDGKAFKKMKNLKTLIIRNVCFSKGPKHLPNSLRVLEWQGYPSTSLPSDFYPKKLVILDLSQSCLMTLELAMSKKEFTNLTVLNFDRCQWITEIPDVSGVPNLEKLSFSQCENLIKIHESVGFLKTLRILKAAHCNGLRTFPPIKLTSLEELDLWGCSRLESFPEILGKMEAITDLELNGTDIKELPVSIQYLTKLRSLVVNSYGMFYLPITFLALEKLYVSNLRLQLPKEDIGEEKVSSIYSSNLQDIFLVNCYISDDFLRKGLTWLSKLKRLQISDDNNLTILPACIKECHFLRYLNLDRCMLLRQIEGIPPNLETLTAKGCTSLNDLDLTLLPVCTKECHFLKNLFLDDCKNLQKITGVPSNIEYLSAVNCESLTSLCGKMLLNQELHERAGFMYLLPETRIPEWFEHCSRRSSISLWFRNNFPTISLCLEFGERNHHPFFPVGFHLELVIGKNSRVTKAKVFWPQDLAGNIYIFDKLQIDEEHNIEEGWNHIEVSVSLSNDGFWIRDAVYYTFDGKDYWYPDDAPGEMFPIQMGLHVVKQGRRICMEDIRFTNPY